MEHDHLLDIAPNDKFALKTLRRALDLDIDILWFESTILPSLDSFYYAMDFSKDGKEFFLRERRQDLATRTIADLKDRVESEIMLFEEIARIGDAEIQKQHILNVFRSKYGNEWIRANNIFQSDRPDKFFRSYIDHAFEEYDGFEGAYSHGIAEFKEILEMRCEEKLEKDEEKKMRAEARRASNG